MDARVRGGLKFVWKRRSDQGGGGRLTTWLALMRALSPIFSECWSLSSSSDRTTEWRAISWDRTALTLSLWDRFTSLSKERMCFLCS